MKVKRKPALSAVDRKQGFENYVGVFDLFKIGIGPSSSHSVGPMRAAEAFLAALPKAGFHERVRRIRVDLYGSLALTGLAHRSDVAVLMGLIGERPDEIDPDSVEQKLAAIRDSGSLLYQSTYYSVGGGFIIREGASESGSADDYVEDWR